MKKILRLMTISMLVLGLATGCGEKTNDPSNDKESKSNTVYSLKYNNMNIEPGKEFSRDTFGEELEYMETPSCAFEDMDRVYTYEHYEIETYTENNVEKILSVYFLDTDIATNEGIKIGDSFTKMTETYGEDYENLDNLYTYTKDKTKLEFIVENEVITSIQYLYNVD